MKDGGKRNMCGKERCRAGNSASPTSHRRYRKTGRRRCGGNCKSTGGSCQKGRGARPISEIAAYRIITQAKITPGTTGSPNWTHCEGHSKGDTIASSTSQSSTF